MRFSVIVTTRAFNDYLKECILNLQKVRYYDFEVIIILDTFTKINFGRRETRFKVYEAKPGEIGPAQKRNYGAFLASGDILAFLDDDAYPDMYWLRKAANIFEENKDLYALGGPAVTPPGVPPLEEATGQVLESYLTSATTNLRHVPKERVEIDDYPAVNLFVKKEAFEAVGGFQQEYWPGEDTKLCLDLVQKYGRKFLYDPEPLVFHHRRELFKPYFQQISRYGMHRGRFARVFPGNSRKLHYFIPSLFILGLFFGPIASVILFKTLSVYLGVIFLYLILVFLEAQKASLSTKSTSSFKSVFLGIIGSHWYYGLNFIKGFFKAPKFEPRPIDEKGNYLGG